MIKLIVYMDAFHPMFIAFNEYLHKKVGRARLRRKGGALAAAWSR